MKSISACTDTKACYCLSRDGGVAGWTSRGGGRGEGEVTCLRFPLSHIKDKQSSRYINGLTLDITVNNCC